MITTALTENLAPCFETKYLEYWCFVLVLHYVFLNRVLMVKTRFYQMVNESKNEFLSVFLHAESVGRHYFLHKRPDHSYLGSPWLVCFLNAWNICAQQTLVFFVTKYCMLFPLIAILMEWHSMGQTLHYGIKETGIASIFHTETYFLIYIPNTLPLH